MLHLRHLAALAAAGAFLSVSAPATAQRWVETRTRPIPITVESFRGSVEICQPWCSGASIGRIFSEGATVETGANAFVHLILPDGSRLALPSNTRVRFDRMRRIVHSDRLDRLLTLEHGRVESEVTPMTDPGSRFVVATPVAISAVRGTLFRSEYDTAQARGSSGVLHGAVEVEGKTGSSRPVGGQGVTATPAGVSPPKQLLPPPVFPPQATPKTEPRVSLPFDPVAGAQSYRIRLTSDPRFQDVLQETVSQGATVTFDGLVSGVYYVQATAIATDGLEGLPGSTSFLRLKADLKLAQPVLKPNGKGSDASFLWSSEGDANVTYRFVLKRAAPDGAVVEDRTQLKANHVEVSGLKPGDYQWSVVASHVFAGQKVEDFSDPQNLRVGAN